MSYAQSIPASQDVSLAPSVLSAGGNALDLNGLALTPNPRLPIGQVLSFPTPASVGAYFGAASQEAQLSTNYFLGFDTSNVKPGAMLFAQYNQAPVGAWLRGGSVASLTLTQLQSVAGVLTVAIDGVAVTSGAINLSAATSFSNAAALINAALAATGPTAATFTGAIALEVLTVTGAVVGTIANGNSLTGAGVTAGTTVGAQLTGTPGGDGTYTVSVSQTVAGEAMTALTPAVTYDPIAGAFVVASGTTGATSSIAPASGSIAAGLMLTTATGAIASQGAVAAAPATFMAGILNITTNWCSFMLAFLASAAVNVAFAAWCNSTVDDYWFCGWDEDITATEQGTTTSAGYQIEQAEYSGATMFYAPLNGAAIAAFAMGYAASLDFTQTQGRATLKFKTQTGLSPDVTSAAVAANLDANGYNYYAAVATRNQRFLYMRQGSVSGPFEWADSYLNQIWMNNAFQLAMLLFLTQAKSVPYNQPGYTSVEAACLSVILQALNFGAIQPGVTLSTSEIAAINNSAGKDVATPVSAVGYYLQILDALPQVRAARASPPMTFWYADGGSIQKLALASVEVQ